MSDRSAPRPGGRSARIQAAVHQAVHALQQELGRDGLTVPAIAARAGVTPSTIYRRWGDLAQLLADVAIAHLHSDQQPADMGSFDRDLYAWLAQYFEEMSSAPGQAMLRDVLGASEPDNTCRCDAYIRRQIEALRESAVARGETPPDIDRVIVDVVAPLMYRLVFARSAPTTDDIEALLARLRRDGAD